jgi:hypothetical protein
LELFELRRPLSLALLSQLESSDELAKILIPLLRLAQQRKPCRLSDVLMW